MSSNVVMSSNIRKKFKKKNQKIKNSKLFIKNDQVVFGVSKLLFQLNITVSVTLVKGGHHVTLYGV